MESYFASETDLFIKDIRGLHTTLPLVTAMLNITRVKVQNDFSNFISTNKIEIIETGEDSTKFNVPNEFYYSFHNSYSKVESISLSSKLVPRSFIVSLISQYDAYFGRIIRTIFNIKPEMLNSSEKNILYSQLAKFPSIDDAREYIIEKEIESVLRKSHSEQFDWLESKLDMTLRKDLIIWPVFIELTERRNLFVHCNGIISNQYLNVCKENKVVFDHPYKPGDSLSVTKEYFFNSYKCIFEIGVKLSQVIWRKLDPSDVSAADDNLISICFDLICCEEYDLAIRLLEFATVTLKKWSDDESKRIFIINKAQAYKWNGHNDICQSIISSTDWSSCDYKFKLSTQVLLDDFDSASRTMRLIGANGTIKKSDYRTWPLFKEFVKTEVFFRTYEDIYGEVYCSSQYTFSQDISVDIKYELDEVAVSKEVINKR